MKSIRNRTGRPLRVPLPRGKVLHLGLAASGQIADGALDHPALQRLLKKGEIEVLDEASATTPREATRNSLHRDGAGHHPRTTSGARGDR